jgi:hypothetical protein
VLVSAFVSCRVVFCAAVSCRFLRCCMSQVICLDNFFTGTRENVVHLLDKPNFELIRHDVVNPILLEVDEIYHLACPASPVHYKCVSTFRSRRIASSFVRWMYALQSSKFKFQACCSLFITTGRCVSTFRSCILAGLECSNSLRTLSLHAFSNGCSESPHKYLKFSRWR